MPRKLDRCVAKVAPRVRDVSRAYAICTSSLQRSGQMPRRNPSDHFVSPARRPGEVRSHYNLNTGGYTVDQWLAQSPGKCRGSKPSPAGKPRWLCADDQVESLLLVGAYSSYARSGHGTYLATFSAVRVNKVGCPDPAGEERRMGNRNVHAHVLGTVSAQPVDLNDGTWRPARYSASPACFVDAATAQCLPNDRSIDVYLASTPNVSGRCIYKSKRPPSKLLPTMWWRVTRG
jgi:hypothetical protein